MKSRSWLAVGALAVAAAAKVACTGGDTGTSPFADEIDAVLADAGARVVSPALSQSRTAADALVTAMEAWSAAPDDAELHAAAGDAWRATMAAWQAVEVVQVGALGSSLQQPGGEGARDEVYSWPTTNPCRVDQETVLGEYESPTFIADHLVNVYGLDAMETLLFSADGVNNCASDVDINAEGTWAALGTPEVQRRRAAYGLVLAKASRDRISALDDAWKGPAAAALAGSTDPYADRDEALQAWFDALFYVESATRDRKLGEPLGLRDCGASSCVNNVETRLAGGSNEWIAINLRSFRAAFTGGDGTGLDDLLVAVGSPDLTDAMIAALDDADAAAAALTVPVDQATDDPAAAALYEKITVVTELLGGDIATVLALPIPSEVDGDND